MNFNVSGVVVPFLLSGLQLDDVKKDLTQIDLLFNVLCVLNAVTNWNLMGGILNKKILHFICFFHALLTFFVCRVHHQ